MTPHQPEHRSARLALDSLIESLVSPSGSRPAGQGKQQVKEESMPGEKGSNPAVRGDSHSPTAPSLPMDSGRREQSGTHRASARVSVPATFSPDCRAPQPVVNSTDRHMTSEHSNIKRERSDSMEAREDMSGHQRKLARSDALASSSSTRRLSDVQTVPDAAPSPPARPNTKSTTVPGAIVKTTPPNEESPSTDTMIGMKTEIISLRTLLERNHDAYERTCAELGKARSDLVASRKELGNTSDKLGQERKTAKVVVLKAKTQADAKLQAAGMEHRATKVELEVVRKERDRLIVRAEKLRHLLGEVGAARKGKGDVGVSGDIDPSVSIGELYKQIGRLEAEKEELERRFALVNPSPAEASPTAWTPAECSSTGQDTASNVDSQDLHIVKDLKIRIAELETMVTDYIATTLQMTEENGHLKQEIEAMRAAPLSAMSDDTGASVDASTPRAEAELRGRE